jgi:hypothetical protein
MKKREIELFGYKVEVIDFGYKQYMYPCFNGNAEFEVNQKGFRKLSHYLRTVTWANNILKERFE